MALAKKDNNNQEDLDFEIAFFETLLKNKPDFAAALVCLGEAYTKRGDFKKGLDIDLRLSRLRQDDPTVHYNLACSYSLLGFIEEAFKTIQKAVLLGYEDFSYMLNDPDLKNLREDRRFNSLLEKLKR